MKVKNHKFEKTLLTLARLHGIEQRYRDGTGLLRVVPSSTLQALLQAMGVNVATYEEARLSLKSVRLQPWEKILDEVLVIWKDSPSPVWECTLPLREDDLARLGVVWHLEDEQQQQHASARVSGAHLLVSLARKILGRHFCRLEVPFPHDLPLGYYRLSVSASLDGQTFTGEACVIVAPRQCYLPDRPSRSWGITAQLYGLTSGRNWGIGDFHDLSQVATWAGNRLGASTLGINPLHALSSKSISPYSPSSRLFFNPLYLDIEAVQEFQESSSLKEQVYGEAFQHRLQALRDRPMVDYEQVRATKLPILESLYEVFYHKHLATGSDRASAFHAYVEQHSPVVRRFAVFQVLQEQYPQISWRQWPVDYQKSTTQAVEDFAIQHEERVRFYQYVQWQCTEQLREAEAAAKQAGLSMGLYHDLAVGIDPDGADAWMFQDQLARGVSIGAPPDLFNLSGQNWNLQPPTPTGLRTHRYRFFRETIRRNMQYGGMLRIDHVLGLFRLYWIPEGQSAREGAYVRYATDELLAIVALESVRNQVMVVGEDLGTVTPEIRRKFARAGLLSYRLLMFEKPSGKGFRTPHTFPEQALASVNTHDLPTLRGFWIGRDIETKEQIGLYPSTSQRDQDRQTRIQDRQALLQALGKERLLPNDTPSEAEDVPHFSDDLCRATYAYLARTPCRVVATSLEDLLGEVDTPNIPGAPEGAYPVWQRKLNRPFEEWQHDQDLLDFATAVHQERSASPVASSR